MVFVCEPEWRGSEALFFVAAMHSSFAVGVVVVQSGCIICCGVVQVLDHLIYVALFYPISQSSPASHWYLGARSNCHSLELRFSEEVALLASSEKWNSTTSSDGRGGDGRSDRTSSSP